MNIVFVVFQIDNWVHNKLKKQRNKCKKHEFEVFTHDGCKNVFLN
jgi:predicted transglutaminase-like protease